VLLFKAVWIHTKVGACISFSWHSRGPARPRGPFPFPTAADHVSRRAKDMGAAGFLGDVSESAMVHRPVQCLAPDRQQSRATAAADE
jgi:hypothetical protein